jgi:hypothetical protein
VHILFFARPVYNDNEQLYSLIVWSKVSLFSPWAKKHSQLKICLKKSDIIGTQLIELWHHEEIKELHLHCIYPLNGIKCLKSMTHDGNFSFEYFYCMN